jgi:hypothetical protein
MRFREHKSKNRTPTTCKQSGQPAYIRRGVPGLSPWFAISVQTSIDWNCRLRQVATNFAAQSLADKQAFFCHVSHI